MIGFEVLRSIFKLIKKSVDAFGRLPGWLQVAVAIAVFMVFAHPKSRAKVSATWESICAALRNAQPSLAGVLIQIGDQFVMAKATASDTFAEIQAILPKPPRRSALKQVRTLYLLNKRPLSLEEIERRMRNQGYSSRSKDFRSYLRRVLRESDQFTETVPDLWALNQV